MVVHTFIFVFIFVGGMLVPGFSETKQGCRNVSYNVQNLHQLGCKIIVCFSLLHLHF